MSISASHRLGMGQLEGRNRTEGRNLKDASLGDAGFRLHPGLTSLPCIRRGCETLKQRRYRPELSRCGRVNEYRRRNAVFEGMEKAKQIT